MNKSILIVDDEERIRKLVSAYLKKDGFIVFEGEDGEDALDIVKNNNIQLVLLDIMMPNMDGWQACREIRKFSNVPIIMLTAKGEEEDKLLGYELGIDKYVTKPFSPKILVAEVKALFKRTYGEYVQKEEEQNNNFDGLEIDTLAHTVKLNGNEIYLSPTEFSLILYFTQNKDIVLTREQILDAIWGIDYFGGVRTVDTHVKRLREKLGEKANLISTIRGTGYKFEVKK